MRGRCRAKTLRRFPLGLAVAAVLLPVMAVGKSECTAPKNKSWVVEIKVRIVAYPGSGETADSMKVEDISPEPHSSADDWQVAVRTLARVVIRHLVHRLIVDGP